MGPPGRRSTGRPSPPPPRGGTSAPTARARQKGAHRRHGESQEGVPQAAAWNESREAAARHPPPPPPHRPASHGGPGPHPPRQKGWTPPAREGSQSVTRPHTPAAGSNGGREVQVGPRLRTGTPRRSCPEKPGGREPEWYGWPRPPWTARHQVTPALLPTQGKRRATSRGRECGDNKRGGKPAAPQPANH